jgi:hypothetical protein
MASPTLHWSSQLWDQLGPGFFSQRSAVTTPVFSKFPVSGRRQLWHTEIRPFLILLNFDFSISGLTAIAVLPSLRVAAIAQIFQHCRAREPDFNRLKQ